MNHNPLLMFPILALLASCAHQSVSLAQLQAVNPNVMLTVPKMQVPGEFVWYWEEETEASAVFENMMRWLPQQGSKTGRLCLSLPNDDQRLQRLTTGWQHVRTVQQMTVAQGYNFQPALCGASQAPEIRLATGGNHGE
jgi:hypothetical protein